jgi:hypothetical protein
MERQRRKSLFLPVTDVVPSLGRLLALESRTQANKFASMGIRHEVQDPLDRGVPPARTRARRRLVRVGGLRGRRPLAANLFAWTPARLATKLQ